MRFWVQGHDPAASRVGDDGDGPVDSGPAEVNLEVEAPADAWAPVPAPADLLPPETVLLVDGVRRIDAWLWTEEPDGRSYPALAASYAAGVVRCRLRAGVAELAGATVARGLFTASPTARDVDCGSARYQLQQVTVTDPAKLRTAVQGPLTALEVQLAGEARSGVDDPGDLLVVDGPLHRRTELPRAIGYIKTHRQGYLPEPQTALVTRLLPGQRSPVFLLTTNWQRYTWYLRLPGGNGAPWSGLIRAECAAHLDREAATALADLSAVTLPKFAATAYKDPRAPQNLIPVAGLEHRLRARLGDSRLLHRALTRQAGRGAPAVG